jgi:hypothetical protein
MRKTKGRLAFAICVSNKGYPASLEVGKLYRVAPDTQAEGHGYLHVESCTGHP